MRPAVFKKVSGGPIKLKDINGEVRILNVGETIVGFFEMFNGLPGLQFQEYGDAVPKTDNTIIQDGNVFNITNLPTPEQIIEVTKNKNTEPPNDPNADKNCTKCKGTGKYSFGGEYGGPIHWSACECVMFKVVVDKPKITIGFDEETLKDLKSKTPKDWMLVKKHQLKEILDKAGIDYSQIKDDRMCLYKFLFSIIKDL